MLKGANRLGCLSSIRRSIVGAFAKRGAVPMRSHILALLVAALTAPACAQSPESEPPTAASAQTQLFQLPEGTRVHDVAPAPDGKIWYTAQRGGALGILDPK